MLVGMACGVGADDEELPDAYGRSLLQSPKEKINDLN